MAKPPRIEYPGAWYYITCTGNRVGKIFNDDIDRNRFLEILERSASLYSIEVHAYILMDNHFHLLAMTPQANLNYFMQRLNTAYTMYYKKRHLLKGRLYDEAYDAILFEANNYLIDLNRYLHLNPIRIKERSGLGVENKKEFIRKYVWSSYPGYISPKHRQPFVVYNKVIKITGEGDNEAGRKKYEQYVMGGILKDMNISIKNSLKENNILGSDTFAKNIFDRFLSQKHFILRDQPSKIEIEKKQNAINEIACQVAKEFDISPDTIMKKRGKVVPHSIFLDLCCFYLAGNTSLRQIGKMLGQIDGSGLSHCHRRLSAKLEGDVALKHRYQKIKVKLDNYFGSV